MYNQDSCYEQNFVDNSQSPPQPQYETYPCKLYGNDSHYGYDCPPRFPLVYKQEPNYNRNNNDSYYPYNLPSFLCCENYLQIINEELTEYINFPSWNHPAFYDDDDDEYSIQVSEKSPIAISPVLPTKEPDNSLIVGDEHLDTILETKSDEVIKSSVEDLIPIPSEFKGLLDNMCDINSLLEEFTGELVHIDPIPPGIDETDSDPKDDILFVEQLLYDDTSSEDDSFKDIDYVEALPLDSELVSLEEVKDEILCAKLLNIHLLIAKIESLNNNPTPGCVLKSPSSSFLSYTDNSSPEFETFSYHTEDTSNGSTTTHANNSFPEYDSFLFEIDPDQGKLTNVVMNDISDNLTNDPLLEEIDLFLASDNSVPLGIENVDYDSEGDILFLEELLRNDSLPFPEFESFHFDLYNDPSSPRPSEKPPDDGGILTIKVVDDISDNSTRELYVHVLNV
nr:hypothetical protein [Tanacetum cinerariifolium]